jgi:hypothetical protein
MCKLQPAETVIKETVDNLRLDVLLCALCQNIALVMSSVRNVVIPKQNSFKVRGGGGGGGNVRVR